MDRLQVKILKSMYESVKLSSVSFEDFLRLKGVMNVEQILKGETKTAVIKKVYAQK